MNLIDDTRRTLAHVISQQMGREILTGELPAGHRLVAEEVQKRYGVSRTAVREALVILTSKGLLTSKPNVGILISPSDRWHLLDRDVLAWAPADGWIAADARLLYTRLVSNAENCADYIAGDPMVKQLLDGLRRFTPDEDPETAVLVPGDAYVDPDEEVDL